MFGQDDKKQNPVTDTQDTNSIMQASLPDPLTTDLGEATPPTPSQEPDLYMRAEQATTAPDLTTPELPSSTSSTTVVPADNSTDLTGIKQQALQQLSPLVGKLEQTPEEKFRTTMMMIQASDDQSLVKTAFEAAQQITDDKTRAQALLDVINEINYFTQHQSNQ